MQTTNAMMQSITKRMRDHIDAHGWTNRMNQKCFETMHEICDEFELWEIDPHGEEEIPDWLEALFYGIGHLRWLAEINFSCPA